MAVYEFETWSGLKQQVEAAKVNHLKQLPETGAGDGRTSP